MALKKAVQLSQEVSSGHSLDEELVKYITSEDCYPSGVGFMGFPKSVCISPNDVLIHGIPTKRLFREGDFMNLDITVFKEGYYGDTSTMVTIGKADPDIERMVF